MASFLIKRLASSEIILFLSLYDIRHTHLGLSKKTKQKAISPPGDLFKVIFPNLNDDWRGRLDVEFYGPGLRGLQPFPNRSLRRQHKNWRIEGDCDDRPLGSPYVMMREGDYAVMEFTGDNAPESVRIYLLSAHVPEDGEMLRAVRAVHLAKGGKAGCIASTDEILAKICAEEVPNGHPLLVYLAGLEAPALEQDAAIGNRMAVAALQRAGRRMTRIDFNQARQRREWIGRQGEEMVNRYLRSLLGTHYARVEWTSDVDPGSPYDFDVEMTDGSRLRIEVKSTSGGGSLDFCISMGEIAAAVDGGVPYCVVRVYGVDGTAPRMKMAQNADIVLGRVRNNVRCPAGVSIDHLWIEPRLFRFEQEIDLSPFTAAPAPAAA